MTTSIQSVMVSAAIAAGLGAASAHANVIDVDVVLEGPDGQISMHTLQETYGGSSNVTGTIDITTNSPGLYTLTWTGWLHSESLYEFYEYEQSTSIEGTIDAIPSGGIVHEVQLENTHGFNLVATDTNGGAGWTQPGSFSGDAYDFDFGDYFTFQQIGTIEFESTGFGEQHWSFTLDRSRVAVPSPAGVAILLLAAGVGRSRRRLTT